jgi:hypothetical protein
LALKTGIVAVHRGADARQDLKLLAAVCVGLLSKPADIIIMVPFCKTCHKLAQLAKQTRLATSEASSCNEEE